MWGYQYKRGQSEKEVTLTGALKQLMKEHWSEEQPREAKK